MLERTQIYVDTSYLLASFYNSWNIGARAQLEIDLPEVVAVLGRMASDHLRQPVHRQLWYDGVPESGPHRYQRSLRSEPGVQFRAGQLIEWGDRRTQKAVDTRLVADMLLGSINGHVSDMILVSGDADMLPGVEEAVNNGVRVHLYGFGWDSMSSALRFACDSVTILDPREDFKDTMRLEIIDEPVIPEGADQAEALVSDNFAEPANSTHATTCATGSTAGTATSDNTAASTNTTTSDKQRTQIDDHGAHHGVTDNQDITAQTPEAASAGAANQSAATDHRVARSATGNATGSATGPTGLTESTADPSTASDIPPLIEKPLGDTEIPEEPGLSPIPQSAFAPESATSATAQVDLPATQPGQAATQPGVAQGDAAAQLEQAEAQTSTAQPDATAQSDQATAQPGQTATQPGAAGSDTHQPAPTTHLPEHDASQRTEAESRKAKQAGVEDGNTTATPKPSDIAHTTASSGPKPKPSRPNPGMMARHRKLRSRYVPLPSEVWAAAGSQSSFDIGEQYAVWWFDNCADEDQIDDAHLLTGGGLPPEIDRPLLQFACETLHEYTLSETQRVDLRDGFHSGIRRILIKNQNS